MIGLEPTRSVLFLDLESRDRVSLGQVSFLLIGHHRRKRPLSFFYKEEAELSSG